MGRPDSGSLGRRAEQLAFDYLVGQSLRPVARNYSCRGGEIDLIMTDNDCLAFIEVRYRKSAAFAEASQTVDYIKQKKIIRTAALFVARNKHFSNSTMRFDVVAIEGTNNLNVRWLRDAFRPNNSTL